MNKSELLTKIKGLKQIEPSDSWVVLNKSFIFKYIKTKEAGEKKIFAIFPARDVAPAGGQGFAFGEEILSNLFLRLKNSGLASLASSLTRRSGLKPWRSGLAVSAASAAVVLIFGGNFLLAKAAGSLPGDAFYPLKLAAEKIQLSLTLNEDKRAALTFEFTGNRLNEYYLLTSAVSENIASGQNVKIAEENLKTQLNAASTEFESAKSRLSPEKKVAMAKITDSKTAGYTKRLKDSAGAKISSNKPGGEVAKIIDKMDEVNTSALTVLATNAGASDSSDSKEVAVKVGEKIKSLEEKIGLIEQKILAVIIEKDNLTSTKLINEAKVILEEAKSALANKDQSKALELVGNSDQISKVAEKIIRQSADGATAGSTATPATEIPIPSNRDSSRDSSGAGQPRTENNTVNTAVPAPEAPTEKQPSLLGGSTSK